MAFTLVSPDNYDTVIKTLEGRLPRSAMSYNVLKMLRGHLHPPTITTEVYAFNGIIVKEGNTDSVFISIIQYRKVYNDYAVVISSPEISNLEMTNALDELVDWSLPICFCAVDEAFSKTVAELCSRNGQLGDVDQCQFMAMSRDKAVSIDVDVSSVSGGESIIVRELSPGDGGLVARRWKFASEGSEMMMSDTIKHTGSAGVYVGGELVSWVVIFPIGSINALYTEDAQRGKGYAALTMRKVCKVAGDKGLVPNVQVQIGNTASKKLMHKVGLEDSHIVEWLSYKPNTSQYPVCLSYKELVD